MALVDLGKVGLVQNSQTHVQTGKPTLRVKINSLLTTLTDMAGGLAHMLFGKVRTGGKVDLVVAAMLATLVTIIIGCIFLTFFEKLDKQ